MDFPPGPPVIYRRRFTHRLHFQRIGIFIAAELDPLTFILCGITDPLGTPFDVAQGEGTSGIVQSKATRRAFVEDAGHRVRFVFTPRYGPWLPLD